MVAKTILIADGGSTKTDWSIVSGNREIDRIRTGGINPFFQTEEEISAEIRDNLIPRIRESDSVGAVYFYGAGCAFTEKNEIISPLGFVLGDEGSGAVLGKLLVGDVLKNQLPAALQEAFWAESGLTPAIIMEKVYKGSFPNRFLASLSPFLLRHIEEPAIRDLVNNSFRAFFARNVMQYDYREHPVYLTGSIAWYYQDILKDVAREFELRLGTIVQSPVQGLIHYHCVL